jgi:hypothetical protein
VLAAYTLGQALVALVIFLAWVAFIGVAIWLVNSLARNENFFPEDRTRKIVIVALLALFAVVFPLLGVPVLGVVWYLNRPQTSSAVPPDWRP